MKDGICPRCGAQDVYLPPGNNYRNALAVGLISFVKVDEYVCCSCGLVETYLRDMASVDKIRKKAHKIEPAA